MIGVGVDGPKAILFRQIATPNYELRQFLRICRRIRYSPVILQYHSDRMSCRNAYKRSLVAPTFVEGISRHGQPYFRRHHLTNLETIEQRRLDEVEVCGMSLPCLHEGLMRLALPAQAFQTVEGSGLFGSYPAGARDYYVDLFAALNGDLLLLEDFVSDGAEAEFFQRVVRPAFDAASLMMGKPPIVMRLCDNRRVTSPLWYAYPASYRAHFVALGCAL